MTGFIEKDFEEASSLQSDQESKVRDLLAVAERLLGEGKLVNGLQMAVSRWRSDVRKINEGASGTLLITVIGTKNCGKSSVIRALVKDPGIREQIPCGIASSAGTRQLIWIGPEGPQRPIPEKERVFSTDTDGLADLGRKFTLLDVPGVDDEGEGLFDLARDAVLAAPVKLLVVNSKELEATGVRRWSRLISEGSQVLPVIIGASGDDAKEERLRQWRERNAGDFGQTTLADPIWIPSIHGATDQDLSDRIRAEVQPALSAVIQSMEEPQALLRGRLEGRWRRFRLEVGDVLNPLRQGLGDSFERWQAKQTEALQRSICELLGDREVAAATLKMDWRLRMTRRMCGLFFPQKAALSLLTVMNGKWDRLTMGAMGSMPSFLMAVTGGIGNLRRHRQMKAAIDQGLAAQLEVQSRGLLTEAARELENRLAKVLGDSGGNPTGKNAGKLSFDWQGVEELGEWFRTLWKEEMEASVAAGSRGILGFYGFLGTAVFWAFLAGPLFALYSTFFAAWGSTRVDEFPGSGWGTLGMGLLLAILPILLLAMVQLFFRPSNKQVEEIYRKLEEEFRSEVKRRSEDGRLLLKLDHPQLDDLGRLMEWLIKPPKH
ncbi:MAG: GTPase domain-containing protein [Opitutales bacterium]